MRSVPISWRQRLWIPLAVVGLAAAYVVGWTLYLEHKLEPIASKPGARLKATPFELAPASDTRTVDIGYASFSLPSTVKGPVVRAGTSGYVCIGLESETSPLRSASVTACAPRFEQDERTKSFLANYNRDLGVPVRSYFDWECTALSTEPFSAWEIWRIGKRESVRRASMLLIKSLRLSRAISFSMGRSGDVGFIVSTEPHVIFLTVEDLKTGVGQEFMIDPSCKDVHEVISAIVASYRPAPTATSLDEAMHLLDMAHLETSSEVKGAP